MDSFHPNVPRKCMEYLGVALVIVDSSGKGLAWDSRKILVVTVGWEGISN